ncbi:MAG: cyclic pyranopterin monophosphate synthase MoaC [Eubacterium sp.]|nr:cyclic pyranopterin monophosphate synthase MoaC [Eubacterium sp.]
MAENICYGVLAGGKSSRMGKSKALLKYSEEENFAEHMLSVGKAFPQKLFSINNDIKSYEGCRIMCPIVIDKREEFGPVEGIFQLLTSCEHPYLLTVATDMPFVTPEFLEAFAGALKGDEDALVLTTGEGNLQPLCSIYSRNCLGPLSEMRAEGIGKIRALFDKVNTRYIDVKELGFDESIVRNINTPEEYEKYFGAFEEKKLNHFDENGNAVMVDVTDKDVTERVAVARGSIFVSREVFEAIKNGTAKKGDVLGVARVAGIMATKRTSEFIPMCHPLMLTKASVDFEMHEEALRVDAICTAKLKGRTGVEMEALTGASVALLTIYDMCKAMDRGMEIGDIYLVKKDGGKSGLYENTGNSRNKTQR